MKSLKPKPASPGRFLLRGAKNAVLPPELRREAGVTIVSELPGLVLVEGAPAVMNGWRARLPGWKVSSEQKASVPDPRPRLAKRLR